MTRAIPAALCLLAAGCASRPLPKYEKPLARSQHQVVRTTAYTHTESDHIEHGRSTAAGGRLRCGTINSAACDWSRWPVGTVFRLAQTGQIFEVDDYGWALAGTNTIDLYHPSHRAMNAWGVRRVDIEILRWGDVQRSLAILRPRSKYRHVRRMLDQIEDRYAELSQPLEPSEPPIALGAPAPRAGIVHMAAADLGSDGVTAALPQRPALKPFHAGLER